MTTRITGHNAQAKTFLDRFNGGRFPHAWLFTGPKGVGKTSLAELLAAVVMGDQYEMMASEIDLSSQSAYSKIMHRNHPDVRLIQKDESEGSSPNKMISVSEIRTVTSFFELQASQGGYRVCIVDSMDDLNANGTNALLKTLEEPPKNSLLILIYHGTTPLLPTIRSRCVELQFNRLTNAELTKLADAEVPPDLLSLSGGSFGKLKDYLDSDSSHLIQMVQQDVIQAWPELAGHKLTKLTREIASSDLHFEVGSMTIMNWLTDRAKQSETARISGLLSAGWEDLNKSISRGQNLRLDLSERSAAYINQVMQLAQRERQGY